MKRIVLSVLVLTGLWGCTQSELVSHEEENVEIRLRSTALSVESVTKSATRSAFEGGISSGNTLTARVLASSATGNYTSTYLSADGTMTFNDDGLTQVGFNTTPQYYPVNNANVYFCGLYPSTGWDADQTITASFTFHGNEDVMSAAQVSSKKDEAKGGTFKTLNFNHLLTQLVISVVAENDAAITAWGNLQTLNLSKAGGDNPNSAVKVTLSSGAVAENGFSSPLSDNSFKFWVCNPGPASETAFSGQSKALTTTATVVAYSMVCPIAADGADDYTLLVTTANSGGAVTVPVNLKATAGGAAYSGNTQGRKFVVTLTFKSTEIQALGSVTDWVNDGGGSEVIQ
ncbi:MAG: fimbrillin family protein [Bacteroides sp.]|jgi:hypothetical protein|nr:fimbrillin family protein [Bacteroides sp.]